jgi:molybdopterin-containing oxidoreductase family iron-sulfur binding subunit
LKEEMQVGINAYLYKGFNDVNPLKAGGDHEFACVQGQKTMVEEISSKKLLWRYLILRMLRFGMKFNGILNHEEVEATKVDLWIHLIVQVGIILIFY